MNLGTPPNVLCCISWKVGIPLLSYARWAPLWYIINIVHFTSVRKKFVSPTESGPCAQLPHCIFQMRELNSLPAFTSSRFKFVAMEFLVSHYSFYLLNVAVVDLLIKLRQSKGFVRRRDCNSHGFYHQPRCSSPASTFGLSDFVGVSPKAQ
jgi:hypothetical protein